MTVAFELLATGVSLAGAALVLGAEHIVAAVFGVAATVLGVLLPLFVESRGAGPSTLQPPEDPRGPLFARGRRVFWSRALLIALAMALACGGGVWLPRGISGGAGSQQFMQPLAPLPALSLMTRETPDVSAGSATPTVAKEGQDRSAVASSAPSTAPAARNDHDFRRVVRGGIIALLAGLGGLAGWMPFAWGMAAAADPLSGERAGPGEWRQSAATLAVGSKASAAVRQEAPPRRSPRAMSEGLAGLHRLRNVLPAGAALVVLARVIPFLAEADFETSLSLLYFAALATMAVGAFRLDRAADHDEHAGWRHGLLLSNGMSLAASAAAVWASGRPEECSISSGTLLLLALLNWGHDATAYVIAGGASLRTDSVDGAMPRETSGRAALQSGTGRLSRVLSASAAGWPPLPGFWLKGAMLLAMAAPVQRSNLSGAVSPHLGCVLLAAVVVVGWWVQFAARRLRG